MNYSQAIAVVASYPNIRDSRFDDAIEFLCMQADNIERARVVGVLDAWAERTGIEPAVYQSLSQPGMWCCDCDGLSDPDSRRCFYGASRAAARAAAAEWVETELKKAGEV